MPSLSNVVAIAAGANHSLAVTSAGQVYAWGANVSSQVGDGTTTTRTSPVLLSTLSNVIAVSAGTSHSLAKTAAGAVYGWGLGSSGQLGLGSTTTRTTPTLLTGTTVSALAAGGTHTVALDTTPALRAWGANGSGQVGDGSLTNRLSPVAVTGPAAVAMFAAGGSHSLAVTPDGHVWSWGAGGSGQLGDGTTSASRSTPQDVYVVGGVWGGTPPPVLTLAPGTYHEPQVASATAMAGAVIRYTTTGATPTTSDPELIPGTPIAVDVNTTLAFRAWAPGLAPSGAVTGTYELQPLPPSATPAAGTYTAAQAVALQGDGGTTIRYTLDGTEPTSSSPTYSTALTIAAPTTLKAKAFRTGWTESGVATATFAFVLPTPTATPPGGVYTSVQAVTLQAAPGATIRYTTDGSLPTVGSPVYSAPILVASRTTIRAFAALSGWVDSAVDAWTYVVDTEGPVITSTYSPGPNAAGWNRGPVEVWFHCVDLVSSVQTCPGPLTFQDEGANQEATVFAVDTLGNQSSITVTVNIDASSSTIAITAPSAPASTTASSVHLVASLSDALSGLSAALCNGVLVPVSSGSVECDVPLVKGANPIIVQARDVADNVASASLTVMRTGTASSLRVMPSQYSLLVGETAALKVLDDFGIPSAVNWTANDESVVTVDQDGTLTGVSAGEATVTATSGTISAYASITVVAGDTLPLGTARWTLAPTPSFSTWTAVGLYDAGSAASAVFEMLPDATSGVQSVQMRGVNLAGEEAFSTTVPVPPGDELVQSMGDVYGGGVVLSQHHDGYTDSVFTITRVSPSGTGSAWQYSANRLEGMAQGADGTIFTVERKIDSSPDSLAIVGLDGMNGRVKFRFPVANDTYDVVDEDCPSDNYRQHVSPTTTRTVTVDANGYANVLAIHEEWTESRPADGSGCGEYYSFVRSLSSQVVLYRVSATGNGSATTLAEYVDPVRESNSEAEWRAAEQVVAFPLGAENPGSTLPDDGGGVLANWSVCQYSNSYALVNCDHRARYVDNGSPASEYSLGPDATQLASVSGANKIAYRGGASITAFNMADGTVVWTAPSSGSPISVLADYTVAVEHGGVVSLLDGMGISVKDGLGASGGAAISPAISVADSWVGLSAAGLAAIVATPVSLAQDAAFPTPRGARTGSFALRRPYQSAEEAAMDMLRQYNPASMALNREFGGLICQFGSKIITTLMIGEPDHHEVNVQGTLGCPVDGGTGISYAKAANYHTHGLDAPSPPSGADLVAFAGPDGVPNTADDQPCSVGLGPNDYYTATVVYQTEPQERFYMMNNRPDVWRYQGPYPTLNTQKFQSGSWVAWNPCTDQPIP